MLRTKCPWCSHKVSLQQLGSRDRKQKPNWYQLTRPIQVCPYCNNPVKVDPRSLRWLLLMLPLLIVMLLRVFFGRELVPVSPYNEIGFALTVIGLLVTVLTTRLLKENDL